MARPAPVFFYVPNAFNAADVLPAEWQRYADCTNYLVSRVLAGMILWEADEYGFVPLKVEYLRRVIPKPVELPLRHLLIDLGVIQCDRRYVKGEKSMGYRLSPSYRLPARRVECRDPRVAGKVDDLRRGLLRTEVRLPVHKYLIRWLKRLEVDARAAMKVITNTPRLAEFGYVHKTSVEMIRSRHVEFWPCDKGRCHTLLTRLPRELRPTLRVDGSPLVNIDVANSQPLVLALYLIRRHAHPLALHTPENIEDGGTGGGAAPNTMELSKAKPIQVEIPQRFDGILNEDELRYVELCERGMVYNHLADAAGLGGLTRDEVKERLFRDVFFGPNETFTDLTRLFGRTFPSVMATIREAKRGEHKQFACRLQTLESNLMIHRVCHRLMTDLPAAPVLTIHDSILTTPPHVEQIRGVMLDEFGREGLRPTLRVERYDHGQRKVAAA